ncbi:MAG: carbon monoxide dehydrogenase subunit G [Nitrososphaerales archaeon]
MFKGTYEVRVGKDKVWAYISNPEKVVTCMPGFKSLEIISEEEFTVKTELGIGWIKGDFDFVIRVKEQSPPSYAALSGHGSGVGSTIDVDLSISLNEEREGETALLWEANVRVGGLLAAIGQRVLKNVAEKIATQLLENVRMELEKLTD